jgi:hypothetical protein
MRIGTRRISRTSKPLPALALFVVAVAGCAHGQEGAKTRPAPRFEGATIPDPPQQGRPWTPP